MLTRLLLDSAEMDTDAPFVTCDGQAVTREQLAKTALGVAGGLERLGVRPGDRVAMICPSRMEMIELLFGCWALGAIAVPLNVFLKGTFLRGQLEDAAPTTIVTDGPGFRALIEAAGDMSGITNIVALDPVDVAATTLPVTAYEELRRADPLAIAWNDETSLASIMFTSGTTGRPKGCMLPHGYYRRVARGAGRVMGLTDRDVVSSPLPLYHFGGQGLLLSVLVNRCSFVAEPEFRVTGQLERLIQTKTTVFAGVGAMGEALLRTAPSALDQAHALRLVYVVPFSPDQHHRFSERFGVDVTSSLYGQTECVPITSTPLDGDRRLGTTGTVPDDLDVRLIDGDGNEVAAGEVGEIVARPKAPFAMFTGYWGADPATYPSADHWHPTGDLGRFDDGYLVFVDRKKDAIRRRGENVSSAEVEGALAANSGIAEVAVFGVPSELTEDDIMAVCVPLPGVELTPEIVFRLCVERLPYFAVPRYVEIADELPKNAVNRVMKHQLRDRGVTERTADLQALGLTVDRGAPFMSTRQRVRASARQPVRSTMEEHR